jgi:hypothetical protein
MFPLSFICPNTNRPASAGIETDPDSLRACWRKTLEVMKCPHCGENHSIPMRDAYTGGAFQTPQKARN